MFLWAIGCYTTTPENGFEIMEFHHPDRLGTRLITDPVNGNQSEQTTLPFGTLLASETTGFSNQRFTSYDRGNITKLDYAVNRQYSSQQGRFTQIDPIGIKSSNFQIPQTLNLYTYCGNDPINFTDPDGLFWGAIGRFFKKLWKVIVAIARAIAIVLNNKWVQIALFALDFIAFGLGHYIKALAKLQKVASGYLIGLRKVLNAANKIASLVSSAVGMIQMADMAIRGKWKELGMGFLWAAAMAPLSAFTSALKRGAAKGLFDPGFDELADIFTGAWSELKDTWKAFKFSFSKAAKGTRYERKWFEMLIPFYGNFCGPGHDMGGTGTISEGINDFDTNACGWHDDVSTEIRADEKILGRKLWWRRFKADFQFVWAAMTNGTGISGLDIAFGQGSPTLGSRSQVITMFGLGGRGVYNFGRSIMR